MTAPRDQVEPGTLESKIDRGGIDQHTAWASMAISLKRIADAVSGGDLQKLYGTVEDIAFHAGRAFENGRRQG